ncbi:MAG: PQQ-binding-like beta-propeller repeat protein [Spirochaetota bacterium]
MMQLWRRSFTAMMLLVVLVLGCEVSDEPTVSDSQSLEHASEQVGAEGTAASGAPEPVAERATSVPARMLEVDVTGGLHPERLLETDALATTDPVVWGDTIVAGFADGEVRAYDTADRAAVWRSVMAGAVDALAAGPTALFAAAGTEVVRLSPVTGEVEWRTPLGSESSTRITRTSAALYLGLESREIVSIDADDGAERWRARLGAPPVDRPVVADGIVYVTTEGETCDAFSAGAGERLWSHRAAGPYVAAPAYAAGRVVLATVDGDVAVLSSDGELLESWGAGPGPILVSPAVHERGIVLADGSGAIRSYAMDGTLEWESSLTSHLAGIPALLGEVLVLGESNGGAVSLDSGSGNAIARVALGDAPAGEPAYVDGRLYVTLRNGAVRPLDVNGDRREVPLFTAEGSWVLSEAGTFRLRDERVSLRMRSERDAVFEISVSSAPAENLVLEVVADDGQTVATNMGKVDLERTVRAPLDAGVSYQMVITRSDPRGEITISIGTVQLR